MAEWVKLIEGTGAIESAKEKAKSKYVIVVPGIVLSEHSAIKDARHALTTAMREGFSDAAIMERTPNGWQSSLAPKVDGEKVEAP